MARFGSAALSWSTLFSCWCCHSYCSRLSRCLLECRNLMARISLASLLCLIAFVQVSFAQSQPATPPRPLPTATATNIFSEEQEVYRGGAVAEHIQHNYRVIEDPEVTAYLTSIGARLTKHLPMNHLRFNFFLVELTEANEFVITDGRIYGARKLVAAAQSEDELVGVIAHELGHLVVHQGAIYMTRNL